MSGSITHRLKFDDQAAFLAAMVPVGWMVDGEIIPAAGYRLRVLAPVTDTPATGGPDHGPVVPGSVHPGVFVNVLDIDGAGLPADLGGFVLDVDGPPADKFALGDTT